MPVDLADDGSSAETVAGLSRTVRRQRVFLVAAVVAALAAGAGLAASTLIESPAQQAADTKPPKATVLTASVVRKVLSNTVVVRGTVGAAGDIQVTPGVVGGGGTGGGSTGGTGGGGGGGSAVVSKLYARAGDQIQAGQLLVEVSGRPIVALTGQVPAYRDLKPGADGPDVAQLQAAMKELGYNSAPDESGHFGPGTKSALTALYTHLGYSVPTTGGPGDAGDQTALQSAATAVTAAQRAVDADKIALDKANRDLTAAKNASAAGTSPTAGNSGSTGGASGGAGAGENPLQAARDARQAAQTAYDNAVQDLGKAKQAQAQAIATTGPMLPTSEVVFVPKFPIRLAKLNATLGSTVTAPLLTLESGQLVVTSTLQPGQNTLIKPGMKVRLDAEALGGQTVNGTVTTIGALNDGSGSGGDSATGGQTSGGQSGGSGGSGSNGANGSDGGSGSHGKQQPPGYPMTVTPDAQLAAAWAGQDVRVTIVNAATPGPVLTVPLSAVSTGADGQSSVTLVAADGTQKRVTVTAGASADGDVEVTPTSAGALHEGDNVVIGQAQQ